MHSITILLLFLLFPFLPWWGTLALSVLVSGVSASILVSLVLLALAPAALVLPWCTLAVCVAGAVSLARSRLLYGTQ